MNDRERFAQYRDGDGPQQFVARQAAALSCDPKSALAAKKRPLDLGPMNHELLSCPRIENQQFLKSKAHP